MTYLLYILIGLLTLYLFLKPRKRLGKPIPGPQGWPFVGNGLDIQATKFHQKLFEYANQYGDIFQVNIFGTKFVVLNSPEIVRKALNNEPYKRHMNDRSPTFYGDKILFGSQSIAFIEKPFASVHGDLRKGFTRAMHVYGEGRKEFEDKVQTELGKIVDKISSYNGEEFDFVDIIKVTLTNITAIVLGGQGINVDDDDVRHFWEYDDALNFLVNPQVDSLLRAFPLVRFIPSIYRQRYQEIVHAKNRIAKKYFYDLKETHKSGTVRGLVDFLIEEQINAQENGNDVLFTDERIICILLETIAAGVLTTRSTVSSLFLCLLNYPEYQTKIHEELDAVIGPDRRPTLADRPKCPTIEAISYESMRYVPAVPLLLPHTCTSNINFEGYDVEANSKIVSNAWFIHHDEGIWGDPWTFRPERFLDDNGQPLPNDHLFKKSWLPFGTGRRQCIGESFARSRVFLFVSTLLQRWTFIMDPDKLVPCNPNEGAYIFDIVCLPNKFKCKAVPRK